MKIFPTLFAVILLFSLNLSCEKDHSLQKGKTEFKAGISESTFKLANLIENEMKSKEFRSYLYQEISNKFDGDFNVLIKSVLDHRPELKSEVNKLKLELDPLLQIAIPKHFDQLSVEDSPDIYLVPDLPEKEISSIYAFNNDQLEEYDINLVPSAPVIVLNLNERVTYNPEDGVYQIDESYLYFDRLLENKGNIATRGGLPSGPCNYGRNGDMYLVGLRSIDLAGIEPWISGKPELRLNIMASENEFLAQQGQGNNIMETFYKPKRGDIEPGWLYVNDYLFYWPETYPETVTFKWVEEDGGVFSQDTENITVQFASKTYSVNCPEFLKSKHEVIHETIVPMGNYCNFDYGNIHLNYKLAKYDH